MAIVTIPACNLVLRYSVLSGTATTIASVDQDITCGTQAHPLHRRILNYAFSILNSAFCILHSPFSILHSPFSIEKLLTISLPSVYDVRNRSIDLVGENKTYDRW